MSFGTVRWVIEAGDLQRLSSPLGTLLQESGARSALLIDRTGQLLHAAGEQIGFDTSAFAALTAATFAANDQLAFLIGEREFSSLAHQGTRNSVFLADIERTAILAVLFDQRATLGMVRLRARATAAALAPVLREIRERARHAQRGGAFAPPSAAAEFRPSPE
jgi:predicted regulator of Ras-like GTPase activity (Roadblock/LC7/MglB family)